MGACTLAPIAEQTSVVPTPNLTYELNTLTDADISQAHEHRRGHTERSMHPSAALPFRGFLGEPSGFVPPMAPAVSHEACPQTPCELRSVFVFYSEGNVSASLMYPTCACRLPGSLAWRASVRIVCARHCRWYKELFHTLLSSSQSSGGRQEQEGVVVRGIGDACFWFTGINTVFGPTRLFPQVGRAKSSGRHVIYRKMEKLGGSEARLQSGGVELNT